MAVKGKALCRWCQLGECWTHQGAKRFEDRIVSNGKRLHSRVHQGSSLKLQARGPAWKKSFGKALVAILRHDNKHEVHGTGLMDQIGWVKISHLLRVPSLKRFGGRYEDVLAEVGSADVADRSSKQRLEVKREGGVELVRACQGHSLPLNFDELLEQLSPTSSNWVRYGLHGTFRRNMQSIISEGLDVKYSARSSGLSRAHIHFAVSIDDSRENAGVRGGTDTVVVCDLEQMYDSGMTLYRSKNNVILTPGVDGRVLPEFITKIYDKKTHKLLHPLE